MIEDEELRKIFKTASEEHLQKLEDGLLHLEKHPHDQARLNEVLREAHTLKGDSRMLGVDDVGTLIHQLEGTLEAFKRGEIILSPEIGDRLYQGLDAIRKLVHEAVTGEPASVNVFYILAQLTGANTASSDQNLEIISETDSSLFPDISTESPSAQDLPCPSAPLPLCPSTPLPLCPSAPLPLCPSTSPKELPQLLDTPDGYQIETIRVEPGVFSV